MGVPADSLAASVHEGGHGGAHRLIPLLRGGLDPAAQDSLQGCVLGPNLDWTALDTAYSALQAGPAPLDPLSTFSCWAPAEALEVLKDTELLNCLRPGSCAHAYSPPLGIYHQMSSSKRSTLQDQGPQHQYAPPRRSQ